MRSIPKENGAPRYQGRNNPKPDTPTPARPPIPVGGLTSEQRGRPGGRFGKGGWKVPAKNTTKKNFLERTPEQELEAQKKRAMRETKRKVIKSRIAAVKTGPNEKQNQLLGGE